MEGALDQGVGPNFVPIRVSVGASLLNVCRDLCVGVAIGFEHVFCSFRLFGAGTWPWIITIGRASSW